jgi:hypothetical protein
MKVEIDVNSDAADFLIVENLKQTIALMKRDYELRETGEGIGIFSTNKDEDLVEIARHLDAFKITLSYFGVNDEDI